MTATLLAITDETSVCECCGKSNLKRVVVLELADGSIVRYGTDCAGKMFRGRKADYSSAVDLLKYVQKWSAKYTLDIVVKGIQNKLGYDAKLQDGKVYVKLGEWVAIS